jgi:hypothetical protein
MTQSQVINIDAIGSGPGTPGFNPDSYFNNLSLPPINVSQDVDDAVEGFFEQVTGNRESARVLASAVIYTSVSQGINPMSTIKEFSSLTRGDLNQYLVTFLNLNRVGTSVLGLNAQPFTNQFVRRSILL